MRLERGIQQVELAQQLGLSQTNMSNIERGRTGITLLNLIKVQKILGCEINELFDISHTGKKQETTLDLTDVANILRLLKNSEIKGL